MKKWHIISGAFVRVMVLQQNTLRDASNGGSRSDRSEWFACPFLDA